ncbi:hypothetical protein [Sphingopyxis sp.]|uniref:hypothetical protein n=1 Tax=Sphingopyxis sp. TaxID=1908224 RepID=UPI002B4A7A2A|nr:hypothetical protein [Sphingopyxis sp.]HJS09767.1 hypothetical protein [Sphingopyxis sp.]
MIFHTTFRIDLDRAHEWLACLWQGSAPASIVVREWITLKDVKPHTAVLIWEGDEEAKTFVDRVFGSFGELEHIEVTSSSGMASAFARDVEGYESMMNGRGGDPAETARQVDLRRRAIAAPSPDAAIEAARAWKAEA